MALKYGLYQNTLSDTPNEFMAHPQQIKSHDLDSIVDKMLKRGTSLTKSDMKGVISLLGEVLFDITADGETINLDLFRTIISVSGTFNGASDVFDSKRHSININIVSGKILKEAISKISVEKINIAEVIPHLLELKDIGSKTSNERLTSEGVIEILGSKLKVEGEEESVGLFFINTADQTQHKVETFIENKPSRIIAIAPRLSSGTYIVQIVTQTSHGGRSIKQPRIGKLNKILVVV